jgi:uncharacterized protein YjhX (UPF0386 family)
LLQSAADYNRDGFGFMSFAKGGRLRVVRRQRTRLAELLKVYRRYAHEECVIHLRLRTRGLIDDENTHPFRVADHLYVVHNGTLNLDCTHSERSDTWHLVQEYLKPLLEWQPQALQDLGFRRLLEDWLGPDNKLVFMDARQRRTVVLNQEHGVSYDGLWLSNARWFDAYRFGLAPHRPPMPVGLLGQAQFC